MSIAYFGIQFAFPYSYAVPAHARQAQLFLLISLAVVLYFCLPKGCVDLRHVENGAGWRGLFSLYLKLKANKNTSTISSGRVFMKLILAIILPRFSLENKPSLVWFIYNADIIGHFLFLVLYPRQGQPVPCAGHVCYLPTAVLREVSDVKGMAFAEERCTESVASVQFAVHSPFYDKAAATHMADEAVTVWQPAYFHKLVYGKVCGNYLPF